jgi:hypothetical protein
MCRALGICVDGKGSFCKIDLDGVEITPLVIYKTGQQSG